MNFVVHGDEYWTLEFFTATKTPKQPQDIEISSKLRSLSSVQFIGELDQGSGSRQQTTFL